MAKKLSEGEKLRRRLAKRGIDPNGGMSLNERINRRGQNQSKTTNSKNYVGDFLKADTNKKGTSPNYRHAGSGSKSLEAENLRYQARKRAGYSNF